LKVYSLSLSTYTRRVAVVCGEKFPYELISVDLTKGKQAPPSFTGRQPSRQVPCIVRHSPKISRSPLREEVQDHGTPNLVPIEPEPEALFEQAASPSPTAAVPQCRMMSRSGAHVANSLLLSTPSGYEVILGKQKCLAGDNLTPADLFHLPAGSTLVGPTGYAHLFEGRPNVAR
ncbi:hypothetical protein BV22DRAFT_1023436, partial [Leucogyrophana mollusca]